MEKGKEASKNESRLRRKVNETIQKLIDEVTEEELVKQLPFLDCLSWDEVVEERYLGKCCGLPICSNAVILEQPHKYHIDRKSNKIFETCKERSKFCCSECFDSSVDIRAQLDSQPLWITGESFRRMSKKFKAEAPKKMVEQVEDIDPVKRAPSKRTLPSKVEIVEDTLLADMHDLKIAERDNSTTDEDENHDDVHQTGFREDSDDDIVLKKKKENDEFKKSVQRFVSARNTPSAKEKRWSIQTPSPSGPLNLSEEEKEKLARIREKYSKRVARKAPILIDAPSLSVRKAHESNSAERTDTAEEIEKDSKRVPVSTMNNLSLPDPSLRITACSSADEIFVIDTLRKWWTDKSRSVLKSGGLRPSNDIDKLLRKFLAGERGDDIELEDVDLPELDAVDVEKKRLQILLQNLKPSWLLMEQRLGVRSSQVKSLSSLLGSFRLGADNIAGFERQQLRLLTAVIWRIVCWHTEELEEAFFPSGYFSKEICDYLEFCGVEEPVFARICDQIFQFVQ